MSDRKYRQKGYRDDDGRPSSSPQEPSGRREEGPRGRGLGAPTQTTFKCSRCGNKLGPAPDFEETCSNCGSDVHTCSNCRFLDPSAPNECRLPVQTRITAKSKRNRCEEFEPKLVQVFSSDSGGSAKGAKAAFDDLFNF